MSSVSATSAVNAWATGLTVTGSPCSPCSLTSHWNGKKWQTLTPPAMGYDYGEGAVVTAIAGGRAWFFLETIDQELGVQDVSGVEWTGTSWSAIHDFGSLLPTAFIASGPDDVWGFGSDPAPYGMHYNGTTWSQIAMPVYQAQWSGTAAAGDWVLGTLAGQPTHVELVHWSKGAWRNAVLPRIAVPAGYQMSPGSVAAATMADIWVSVSVGPAKGRGTVTTYLLHWNGKAWSKALLPKGASVGALASDGHGGAWVAWNTGIKGNPNPVMVMDHYSAGRWTRVATPVKSGYVTGLGSNMELIPGTQSVLGSAELYPANSLPIGAVLKYGP
jgi:hypothetical protein